MTIQADGTWPIDDLVFAATSRCRCGAGLAYIPEADKKGSSRRADAWFCSDWLTGKAPAEDGCIDRFPDMFGLNDERKKALAQAKHDAYPFVFYEVRSEGQPSANGATTRRPDQLLVGHAFTLAGKPGRAPEYVDSDAPDKLEWRTRNKICGVCLCTVNAHKNRGGH